MSQPPEASIIDYASPMKRSPLRLAKKSILRVVTSDEEATITETLAGKAAAIFAMTFTGTALSLFTLTISGIQNISQREPWWLFWYAAMVCAALLLALKIIDATWRNTMLQVRPGELLLDMKSPFRATCYFWQPDQIQQMMIAQFPDPDTGRAMNELQIILLSGQQVNLFTGHDFRDLADILALLQKHFRSQLVTEARMAVSPEPNSSTPQS